MLYLTYVDKEQTLEVLVGVRDQVLAVGAVDAAVTVENLTGRQLLALWEVDLEPLVRDGLPRGQSERAGFNGVCGCHDLVDNFLLATIRHHQFG